MVGERGGGRKKRGEGGTLPTGGTEKGSAQTGTRDAVWMPFQQLEDVKGRCEANIKTLLDVWRDKRPILCVLQTQLGYENLERDKKNPKVIITLLFFFIFFCSFFWL